MIEWIPVTERLPDGKDAVLVCYHWSGWVNQMEMAQYVHGEWQIGMYRREENDEYNVTHWTELNSPTDPPK